MLLFEGKSDATFLFFNRIGPSADLLAYFPLSFLDAIYSRLSNHINARFHGALCYFQNDDNHTTSCGEYFNRFQRGQNPELWQDKRDDYFYSKPAMRVVHATARFSLSVLPQGLGHVFGCLLASLVQVCFADVPAFFLIGQAGS